MKLLVLGGTYFLGKAFVEACDDGENKITVLNRGSRKVPGNEDGHVKELRADRTDEAALGAIRDQFDPTGYDCVVDFCAYAPGDIRRIMEFGFPIRQYVFVSTCDVYEHRTGRIIDETAPYETRDFGGQEGAYISGKVALERELREEAAKRGIRFTSVRPAFIYGPGNYAPREGMFFEWVSKAGQVLFPEDADGTFQMVYVNDLARFLRLCTGNEKAFDEAFNVCGEQHTYQSFLDALDVAIGAKITRVGVTVQTILERGIPLPFPLTKAESEDYDASKSVKLGFENTPLSEGLRESYIWFLSQEESLE
ncbi:MAG: NAD-dependent epimerase/dehydratase family protein [Lachnospiraceae bacterium]|nr:NAD-dependent epimerase/dehydratase family protein [Lachnospiraceae bacterium]